MHVLISAEVSNRIHSFIHSFTGYLVYFPFISFFGKRFVRLYPMLNIFMKSVMNVLI